MDFTPSKSGGSCGHAPAGCGPVAVAQVLWYYRTRLNMTYNGVRINFNNMLQSLNPNSPGRSPDIARLMRFVGDRVIIDWAASYALALPSKIPDLFNSLGFSSELKNLDHRIVQGALRAGRPVIFKARTSGPIGISLNHHIWVCEGYRTLGYGQYFMNWGWNGGANGWYYIDNWQAQGGSKYSEDRKMILVR